MGRSRLPDHSTTQNYNPQSSSQYGSKIGHGLYNLFADFLKIHRVPIKILDEIRIDRLEDPRETVCPTESYESDPALHDRYSAAIYARLEVTLPYVRFVTKMVEFSKTVYYEILHVKPATF